MLFCAARYPFVSFVHVALSMFFRRLVKLRVSLILRWRTSNELVARLKLFRYIPTRGFLFRSVLLLPGAQPVASGRHTSRVGWACRSLLCLYSAGYTNRASDLARIMEFGVATVCA